MTNGKVLAIQCYSNSGQSSAHAHQSKTSLKYQYDTRKYLLQQCPSLLQQILYSKLESLQDQPHQ